MRKQTIEIAHAAVDENINAIALFGGTEEDQFGTTDLDKIVDLIYENFKEIANMEYTGDKSHNFDGIDEIKGEIRKYYTWAKENYFVQYE